MDNMHMDGRESNEDMYKNRNRWFAEVDRRCRRKIMGSMRRNWPDEAFRKDRYSEALEVLFNEHLRGEMPSDRGRVQGFLITTAKNCCLSAYRKDKRSGARASFGGNAAVSSAAESVNFYDDEFMRERVFVREQLFDALAHGLACLGEKDFLLIRAFYMQDRSMIEIADLLGYASAGSAKKAVCIARGRLREHALAASAAFTGMAA